MELGELLCNNSEYIETASGNKVSLQSGLCGSQNIVLNAHTCLVCYMRPCFKTTKIKSVKEKKWEQVVSVVSRWP
uniref:Uncharacterized protein n=1 Tax=Mus spicilegus TaxID=10103 RepID=A0A8C6HDY1_MUSSI